jgi:hypothetical protein
VTAILLALTLSQASPSPSSMCAYAASPRLREICRHIQGDPRLCAYSRTEREHQECIRFYLGDKQR